MNKHYIRLHETNIIKGFSDAFETPLETDICINEDGGRHFELNGVINPPLQDENGCCLYRCVNGIIETKTCEELEAEHALQPEPPLTELQKMDLDIQTNYEMLLEALGVW